MRSDPLDRLQSHKGFQRLQEAEVRQQTQEQLRVRLGAPAGRAAPMLVKQITLPELQLRGEIQRARPTPRPLEHKTPKLKIDLSRVQALMSGASSLDSTRKRGFLLSLSPPRPSSPFRPSDSFQYALPDSSDLHSFNPFLRPKASSHFFPADLFNLDDTDYTALSYPVNAKGRWWLPDGSFVWRPCKVVHYSEDSGLFGIEWTDVDVKKQLSRFNIMFLYEREEDFVRKLAEASQRRDLLEAALRYETRISVSAERFPEITMPEAAERRILRLLGGVVRDDRDRDRVVEELHSLHRKNIVNFVFQMEHFVSKSLLAIRYALFSPWAEHLESYERKRAFIKHEMSASNRSISFSRAQNKLYRYRYDPDPALRLILHSFLEHLETVQDLNLYAFLLTRSQAASFPELDSIYSAHTAVQIKQIAALSVDASNSLCEILPASQRLTRSCRL